MLKFDPNVVHHPVLVQEVEKRTSNVQLRVADAITAFAGSMNFVYIHAVLFVIWMLAFEKSPWPTLTLVVSLEAIFLWTFVMIGQNRQAGFQQAKADHDYMEEEQLLGENTNPLGRSTNSPNSSIGRCWNWARPVPEGDRAGC